MLWVFDPQFSLSQIFADGLLNGPRLNLDGRFPVLEIFKHLFSEGNGIGLSVKCRFAHRRLGEG